MQRNSAAVKATAGFALAIALGAISWHEVMPVQVFDPVVDQGARALLMVTTEGGNRDYDLQVRSSVAESGDLALTFFFTVDEVVYDSIPDTGSLADPFTVSYSIAAAGDFAPDDFTCGTSEDPVPRQPFDQLPSGTQSALELDAAGGNQSALNYENADDLDVESGMYQEFSGSIWVVGPDTNYNERYEDGGYTFAETCNLATEAIWRWDNSVEFDRAQRMSYLAPQINFSSMRSTTDFQRDIVSTLSIDRRPGLVLTEAYPSPNTGVGTYSYQNSTYSNGNRGEQGNLVYTDQPVFIFSDRDLAVQQSRLLFWGGAALGLAGALFVAALSKTVDIFTLRN